MANTLNNWASAFSSAMLGVASWLNGRKQKVTGDSTATTVAGNFLTNLFGGASNIVSSTATAVTDSVSSVADTIAKDKNKRSFVIIGLCAIAFFLIRMFGKKKPIKRRRRKSTPVRRYAKSKARMPKGTRSAKARMAYVRSFRKKGKKR